MNTNSAENDLFFDLLVDEYLKNLVKNTLMNPLRLLVIACFFICVTLPQITFAQDNLRVSYSDANTVPDFLNVCGETDEVTVTIRVNGASSSPRENITAIANLFEGIQYAGLNVAATSAGVTELPTGSISSPQFSIPDLSPVGVTSVDILSLIHISEPTRPY